MYELAILGMLMHQPVHGFLIVKATSELVGPVARVSNARIYPLLTRLAADGLVEVQAETTSPNGLPMRIYRITDRGRERFHELMLDVTSHAREYRELFAIKVPSLPFLPREERVYIVNRYIDFCRKHINHFIAEVVRYRASVGSTPAMPGVVEATVEHLEHARKQWELELEWAVRLRAGAIGGGESTGEPGRPKELMSALDALADAVATSRGRLTGADKGEYLRAVTELKRQVAQAKPNRTVVVGILTALRDDLRTDPILMERLETVSQLAQQAVKRQAPSADGTGQC
ncbi:MAG TPA: PadR family transcriptional regulator [Symbiobacteriaceae bacterium]|jgi:DNA-binding PadR family transcriptional regulator